MGSRYWRFEGRPYPSLSLIIIPMVISVHLLISIFFFAVLSSITGLETPVLGGLAFVLIAYLLRHLYSRLFFNFYIWLLKQNGQNILDKILLRSLKYSILSFIFLPIILLTIQIVIETKNFNGNFWFVYIFKYSYIFLPLTVLIAFLIEKYVPNYIFNKVEKAYQQIGPLLARIE